MFTCACVFPIAYSYFSARPSCRVRCTSMLKSACELIHDAKLRTKKMRSNLLKRIR